MVSGICKRAGFTDGSYKYLVRLGDTDCEVACDLVDGGLRLRLSTQVGCRRACVFCLTGLGGFLRDLTAEEMQAQVDMVSHDLVLPVVDLDVSGQGEPMDNLDQLLRFLEVSRVREEGVGRWQSLTVSTIGTATGIVRLVETGLDLRLCLSLHSADKTVRNQLMPGCATDDLGDLKEALMLCGNRDGVRLCLDYGLVRGLNDGTLALDSLSRFCSGLRCTVRLYSLRLPPGYPTACGDSAIDLTAAKLRDRGLTVLVRHSTEPRIRSLKHYSIRPR